MDFSPIQIAIVLIIALIVFGPRRLPELGRQVGRSLREAKRQMSELGDEMSRAADVEDLKTASEVPGLTATAPATSDATSTAVVEPSVTDAGDAGDDDLLDGVLITRTASDDATVGGDEPTAVIETGASPDDDLLDGVVVSGDTPPGSPSQG